MSRASSSRSALTAAMCCSKGLRAPCSMWTWAPILTSDLSLGERLKPLVADVTGILEQISVDGGNVLFEGAQGAMLDVDLGTYPYVRSELGRAPEAPGGGCHGHPRADQR